MQGMHKTIFMISLEEAKKVIDSEISRSHIEREPESLYQPVDYILSLGGKRLRPCLALVAASLYQVDFQVALPAALALEVFHNFTLLHDDIMDNAMLRRNMPTVHVKWNVNTAILSGDAMLIYAFQLIQGTDPSLLPRIIELFTRTALEVCEGQQYDMEFESIETVSEEQYIRMIELKTAVLIAASLKIGALCGGSSHEESDILYEAGRNIGLAFQLQDDLLDTYGDTEVFGKKIGGDIRASKKTFLFILAKEVLKDEQRKELVQQYENRSGNLDEKVRRVKALFDSCEVAQMVKERITKYLDQASQCFDRLSVPPDSRRQLKQLVDSLLDRQS